MAITIEEIEKYLKEMVEEIPSIKQVSGGLYEINTGTMKIHAGRKFIDKLQRIYERAISTQNTITPNEKTIFPKLRRKFHMEQY